MKIIKSVSEVVSYITEQQVVQKKICLIPTMGNLHDGHSELINSSPINSLRVVTIYINQLQFDDPNDYINYPKNTESDLELCIKNNVDLIFMPDENFMADLSDNRIIDLPKFTKYMCGATRKGHFLGVYKIVRVLFDMFNPHYACFGKKDYQQLLLIRYIAKTYFKNLKIVEVDIIRNRNNLALSSRLSRLTEQSLKDAELIYKTLTKIKNSILDGEKFSTIKKKSIEELNYNDIHVDYIELRLLDTLEECKNSLSRCGIFIACYINDIRLIDNIEI